MSKKGGKKAKAKVPEIDPNSPEWLEEVARKQTEAYDMVQRAMTRSQIDVVLATRDDLLKQRAELETKAKQQSEDQSDIYQYLRNKLKDNYVAIAELETKVSIAHDDRLQREKQLLATIKDLNEERGSEKTRLEERLAALDVELTAIKEYRDHSEIYQQTLRDMEAKIASCKDAFSNEVVLLNQQLEEEWETGRRDKEEGRKVTKKAAAKATQEQLGPRTKIRIAQNKKMMSELRFQCFEVEKMHRARNGLIKSNTHLLAKAASARHRVEELARRSHLLQRIIRYMHQKLQIRRGSRGGLSLEDASSSVGPADRSGGHQQRDRPAATGARPGGAGGGTGGAGGGGGGESGALYKLAGMSTEERQQMLDLREELRREEVGIAAAQTLVAEMREELLRADAERSRVLALKTDLARVLASCHEDPLLGTDVGDGSTATAEHGCTTRQARQEHHHVLNPARDSDSQPASVISVRPAAGSEPLAPLGSGDSDGLAATTAAVASDRGGCGRNKGRDAAEDEGEGGKLRRGEESNDEGSDGGNVAVAGLLPAIADTGRSLPPPQPEEEEAREEDEEQERLEQTRHPQQQHQHQHQHQQQAENAMPAASDRLGAEAGLGTDGNAGGTAVGTTDIPPNETIEALKRGQLALWPESSILPPAASAPGDPGGTVAGSEGWGVSEAPHFIDAETLKAVARLFLSKLKVSVEAITPRPRPPASPKETTSFSALMSGVSSEDGAGGSSPFGVGARGGTARSRQPRSSGRSGKGAKRKGTGSGGRTSAPLNAGDRTRSRSERHRDHPSRGGGGSGGGDSRLFGDHRGGEGSRASRQSRGRGRSRGGRRWPDDAPSWSDWHSTGIPSWDILEPSVRQTKRRRTRDAACQTLTYRELRDNANAVPCPQNNPAGWKNSYKSPNRPPHGGGAQWYRHQQRQHQQHQPHHHVAPATRFVSMFNPPPGSPLSSAATASTASVYRIIDGGGVVHGAIVRGGRDGGGSGTGARRKQRPPQQQARIPSSGNGGNGGGPEAPEGAPADADVFPPRGAHPGEGGSSTVTTMTARPQNRDFPLDGHGALLCSPPPPSPQADGAQGRRTHEDQGGQDSAPPTAGYPDRRPEITDSQRLSPNVAQVTVSWGGGAQGEGGGGVFQEEGDVSPFTAEHAPEMEVPSCTRGGRGPEAFRGDHETGYQDVVAGLEGPASGAYGGGGRLVYEPPSKGPDYRKVLLFTVNDTDCRILRRPAATDESKRSTATNGAGVTPPSTHRDASGTIPGTASGKRGTSRSSSSRQRGRTVPAGANFVKKSVSSSTVAARTKGRLPARLGGDGLFVGNGSKVPGSIGGRGESRGGSGGITSAGIENRIVWDRDSGEIGLDGGPTLCSSMSTLSGDAF